MKTNLKLLTATLITAFAIGATFAGPSDSVVFGLNAAKAQRDVATGPTGPVMLVRVNNGKLPAYYAACNTAVARTTPGCETHCKK